MNIENFTLNVELFYFINHARHPLLDDFFKNFYLFGKGYVLLPVLIYVSFLQRRKIVLFTLSVALESTVVYLLKLMFDVPRPASMLKDVYLLENLYHKSFPSGDTAMAFLLACFFSQRAPFILKFLLFTYAFLIAYGRVYLGVHFPLDVFSGALIGIFSYGLVKKMLRSAHD
ncbi:MAG: phosphatase PAP2 family protein [Aquificaceae bacterium]